MGKRSHGKRYDTESKLNIKKVIAVLVAIAVIVMFVVGIKTLLTENTGEALIASKNYYPVYTNQKWGVIDQTGKIIIEPEYTEMITIPDSKTDLFVCVYDVNYTNNTYKTKVIDSKNKLLFTGYDLIEVLENMDENNNLWYEESALRVKKGNLYGLIDFSGKEILPIEYSSIEVLPGIKNSFVIKKEGKVGLCDKTGKIIINPEYKEIKAIGKTYQNGYIVVDSNDKYGVVDFTGKIILEPAYEDIKQVASASIFIVKENGKIKAINKDKEVLIEENFDDVKQINSENLIFKKDGKYGVMNINKDIKVKAEYEDLQYIFGNYYIAKKAGKYGVINLSNEVILPIEFTSISYNEEKQIIATVKDNENKYYNSSMKEVSKNETKSNDVVENIGKWHLAEDLNSYYYTDKD